MLNVNFIILLWVLLTDNLSRIKAIVRFDPLPAMNGWR